MVIYKFSGFGVLTLISLCFVAERPHHLRMAIVATIGYVYIASVELKRGIGFYTGYGRDI
jgi:hypothetical protein